MATYDPNRVYVIVAGANLVIKHQRPTGRVGTQTGRIEKEAPIHISNVMLVGGGGKPTRAGYEVAADGSKERVDRKTRRCAAQAEAIEDIVPDAGGVLARCSQMCEFTNTGLT